MGNAAGSLAPHPSEEELEERRFREKIGYISVIKQTGPNGETPVDLVSTMMGNTHSWATSVTSITESLGSRTKSRQDHSGTSASHNIYSKSKTATATTTTENKESKSSSSAKTRPDIQVIEIKERPLATATATASAMAVTRGRVSSTGKKKTNQRIIMCPQSNQKSGNKSKASSSSSNGAVGGGAAAAAAAASSSNSTQVTEALIVEMQRKMAKVDQEQDSCLHQIRAMNQEMESYRRDTLSKLQEKDATISLNETEIACLKQQILKLRMEQQEEKTNILSENRTLQRKVNALQNQLMVVELDKEAAVTAAEAAYRHSVQEDRQSCTASSNLSFCSPEVMELRETIQELLQQLEEAEDDHQREQDILHEEVLLLRRKLERLESEFIAVERERDEALQKVGALEQQFDIERALNASDLKKYQDEVQKWKERVEQELKFSAQTKQSHVELLRRTAATLGSRLGAGILEGIQEEEAQQCSTNNATGRSMDDMSDAYSRLVGKVNAVAVASTPSRIEVTVNNANSSSSPRGDSPTMDDSSSSSGSTPVWVPDTSSKQSQAFDETISIPNFLSQVW